MGFVNKEIEIYSPTSDNFKKSVCFIVDTGALYSIVPAQILEELKINKVSKRKFKLANGEVIERWTGHCAFKYLELVGISTVIFGENNDTTLLGVTALEELGLEVSPATGELKPMTLLLLNISSILES